MAFISADNKEKFSNASELTKSLLRLFILGTEKGELKASFSRGEIDEKIYKKILNILDMQMDRVEQGRSQLTTVNEKFPIDGFEKFINKMRRLFFCRLTDCNHKSFLATTAPSISYWRQS